MGVCRTELDNGRKAICDCTARLQDDFDDLKTGVPSCANITSDMIKTSRKFHSPFLQDCGPDPCDSTFQSLTQGHRTDDENSPEDSDSTDGHKNR